MTPKNYFDMIAARAGIHTPDTNQYTRIRTYWNLIKTEAESLANWRFLYKTSTITTVASTRSYALASDVLYPLHFWDYTNNKIARIMNPEDITDADPDEDQTGEGVIIAITGISSSTGYWQVDIYPTPDTSSETIKYRYRAFIADFASTDDETDLGPKYPAWFQNALFWGTSEAYLAEKNMDALASEDGKKYEKALEYALNINGALNRPARFVLGEARERRMWTIVGEVTPD